MTSLLRISPFSKLDALIPRANWGRWIVDCPRCTSALAIDPEWGWTNFRERTIYDREYFECWDCGYRGEVDWPPDELIYSVERLLMMRPDPKNRNFDPKAETINELMWENGAHGIFDDLDQLDLHGVSDHLILSVGGEGIKVDRLPMTGLWRQHSEQREITGG